MNGKSLLSLVLSFSLAATVLAGSLTYKAGEALASSLDLAQYVDQRIASDSQPEVSARYPFGRAQFLPQTAASPNSFTWNYVNDSTTIYGFHADAFQNSAVLMPIDVPVANPASDWSAYTSTFAKANEVSQPGYYKVTLDNNGAVVESAAALRSLIVKISFAPGVPARLLVRESSNSTSININAAGGTVQTKKRSDIEMATTDIFDYLHADKPIIGYGTFAGDAVSAGNANTVNVSGTSGYWLDFNPGETVTLRISNSQVSFANAIQNADSEIPAGTSLNTVRTHAYNAWNALLNRVQVSGGSTDDYKKFYSFLYSSIALGQFHITNDYNGQFVDWNRKDSVNYTVRTADGYNRRNFIMFWDYNRGLTPMIFALFPEVALDTVKTLLDYYDMHKVLPRTLINRGIAQMSGDGAVEAIVTAYAMGATNFDTAKALSAMKAQANGYDVDGSAGQRDFGLDHIVLGYVPYEFNTHAAASISTGYYNADFTIAYFASLLGDTATYNEFLARANNWKHLIDPNTKFIKPRQLDGTFISSDTSGFEEEDREMATGSLTFNQADMVNMLGLSTAQSRYNPLTSFGNQPQWHGMMNSAWADQAFETQETGRNIWNIFNTGTGASAYGGGEYDAMFGSWAVLAGMGLFPAIWGTDDMIMTGTPFSQVKITIPGHNTATITANNNSPANRYISSATVNGAPYSKSWIRWSDIRNGASIVLNMTSDKNDAGVQAFGAGSANRPRSWSSPAAVSSSIPVIHYIDDANASVTYSGDWWTETPGSASNGTLHASNTPGATATFTFTGTRARYKGVMARYVGAAEFYVDGVLQTVKDMYNETPASASYYDFGWFQTDLLPYGTHTLTVKVLGTKLPNSQGANVYVDGFQYIGTGTVTPTPPSGNKYEAEDAAVTHANIVGSGNASGGQYVGQIDYNDSSVQFSNVSVPAAGTYSIRITYANGMGSASSHLLSVNGGTASTVSYPATGGWGTFGQSNVTVYLNGGSNTLQFMKNGYAELDCIEVFPKKLEAEDAVVTHANIANGSGASGGKYVAQIDYNDSSVLFSNVYVPTTGSYAIQVRYANGAGSTQTQTLSVNGGAASTVSYPATGGWGNFGTTTLTVALSAGVNTLRFGKAGYTELDYIQLP